MNKLEERVLKEGKVLEGEVLKVGHFLNHQIDINLLNDIGKEFYNQFKDKKIDKVVTIEASGIAMATVVAQLFNVPFVFAKKDRSNNISKDVYSSNVYSYTYKTNYTITISKEFLHENENILLIDDFLANGAAIHGLIEVCEKAKANIVGIGICIEKGFQDGGNILRKQGYNIKSLVNIKEMSTDKGIVLNNQ